MTSLARSLLVLSTSLAFACGDGGLGHGADGGGTKDMTTKTDDAAVTMDAATGTDGAASTTDFASAGDFGGISCGTATCGAGSVCCIQQSGTTVQQMCVTGTTCADGGITAACDGPEDCSTAAPSCCADVTFDQTSMTGGGNAMCTATCPGSATFANNKGAITTKLCHSAGDCMNYSGSTPAGPMPYDHCCSRMGATYKFCAPAATAQFASGVDCGP